ncbi:PAS domain S-box protein [Tsukamurella pulmonis]|uniref:PAS domain S-box protein n=1 Tax=Tsukamurella pulmonis TaxID=47312 RepID=UPI0009E77604|nr:PAS domain S-box protein [Tsukamurella pulmonis]RDH10758.1 PAS domain S-box protein [Tsukamurella pulmonis]
MNNNSPTHATIFVDPKGFVQFWNDGAEQIFGHSADEIIGRSMEIIIPPAYRERHWKAFDATMASTGDRIDTGANALPGSHKDGSMLDLEVRLLRIPDSRNNSAGAFAVFSPVSATLPPLDSLYD